MSEKDDKKLVTIMEKITEMPDEDFCILCKIASQNYGHQVVSKLRDMVNDINMPSTDKYCVCSCGQACGQIP